MAQQKVVLKVMTMTDDKTKQKAIEAAADIFGIDSIAADLKDQKRKGSRVGGPTCFVMSPYNNKMTPPSADQNHFYNNKMTPQSTGQQSCVAARASSPSQFGRRTNLIIR
ncbi:hypothetical protein PRUPE_4G228300 [Prunus persica]|uniref:Uncharacterized protein n=1 Tax=Prunus persica TaxID=3760 RepID=M5X6G4_PRUPE|nr:hypothetical protein PRUPE_4G228300 [Prunus persica]